MNKRNYQKEMEQVLDKEKGGLPRLLIHSCCAPCSSYVLEYLSQYFSITVFYYNPNIYPPEEYDKRVKEQEHFIEVFPAANPIGFVDGAVLRDSNRHGGRAGGGKPVFPLL